MADSILDFFACDHLPPHLQVASAPFGGAARKLMEIDSELSAHCGPLQRVDLMLKHRRILLVLAEHCLNYFGHPEGRVAYEKVARCIAAGVADDRLLLEAKDCAVRAAMALHRKGRAPLGNITLNDDEGAR